MKNLLLRGAAAILIAGAVISASVATADAYSPGKYKKYEHHHRHNGNFFGSGGFDDFGPSACLTGPHGLLQVCLGLPFFSLGGSHHHHHHH